MKTKHSFARIAEKNSFSLQVSRNFTLKRVLKMNPSVAESAARHANRAEAESANFTPLFAENAAAKQGFPLNLRAIEAYFAARVLKKRERHPRNNARNIYICVNTL